MSSNEQFNANDLVNDVNPNLVETVISNNIYWENQNDESETFATLFANTLLHDDFSKETEFDCLGLDNLQLSYNSINNNIESVTNLNPNESTINFLHLGETSHLTELQSLNINEKNQSDTNNNQTHLSIQFNEFDLKLNLNSVENHEPNNLNEHVIENLKASLEETGERSSNNNEEYARQDAQISNESAFLIKQLTDLTTFDNNSNSEKISSNILSPAAKKAQEEDDKVFKKPLNDQIYFSNFSILNASKKAPNENDLLSKISTQSTHHHKNKLKDLKTIGPKKQFISIINEKSKKEKNSSLSGVATSNNMNDPTLFPSLSNKSSFGSNNFASSMNKLLSLKRSRKRSKMTLNSGNIPSGSSIQQMSNIHPNILDSNEEKVSLKPSQQSKKLSIIKQNKLNLNSSLNVPLVKYTNKKSEKLKQLKSKGNNAINTEYFGNSVRNTINFEPMTKKLAVDSNPELSLKLILNRVNTKNFSKKDEVDLDIKELSLLDSHSSEEDSTEIFLKGRNSLSNLKKNIRSSSNDNVYLLLPSSSNEKNNNNLNELLSKRVKYSPANVCGSCLNTQKDHICKKKSPSETNRIESSDKEENTTDPGKQVEIQKESKINKFIQYLTKSLDSNSNSISSNNNSSNESLENKIQKQDSASISSLSSYKSNSSCSILNSSNFSYNFKTQNKRKKKDSSNKYFEHSQKYTCQLQQSQDSSIGSNTHKEIKQNDSIPRNSNGNVLKKNCSFKNLNPDSLSQLNLISNSFSLENDTVEYLQNLDINNDLNLKSKEQDSFNSGDSLSIGENFQLERKDSNSSSVVESTLIKQEEPSDINLKLNLNDPNSRKYLWNLLKKHSTLDELCEQFGSSLHNKISFWDLVQLKLKFSKTNRLKTTYEIIDDYTLLYSNMSTLLERIVNEHSQTNSGKKNENSSRSRSSSRNYRKQSGSFSK